MNNKKHRFYQTYEQVEKWLKKHNIVAYEIKENLVVDVHNNISLDMQKIKSLPVQFGKVYGDFSCVATSLETLQGFPHEVTCNLWITDNALTSESLKDAPAIIGLNCYLFGNPITSLKELKSTIGMNIFAQGLELSFDDIDSWNSTIKDNIILSYHEQFDYLQHYRDKSGDIDMSYDLFKKVLKAKKLNDKLESEMVENGDADVIVEIPKKLKL
jgi:hypothetical protein